MQPRSERHYKKASLLAVAVSLVLAAGPAQAGAWIPEAGSGSVEPMLRYSFANGIFPSDAFSFSTHQGSTDLKTQLRILGEHGLGNGFSLEYDFRYAFVHHSSMKNGVLVQDDHRGFQEQRIGLDYGLTQGDTFADNIGIGVVVPGGSSAKSHLDSGRWAIEPIYHAGFKAGFWKLTGQFDIGSRIFLDGGAAQFRSHLEIGAPIFDGVHLSGKLLFARTARLGAYESGHDRGELYDVLRVGLAARFHIADGLDPVVAYEREIAGMGRHADQRLTIGFKLNY